MRPWPVYAALLAGGCAPAPRPSSPAESAQAIAVALRSGRVEQAVAAAARGRMRHPDDGDVALWSGLVADCLWQDVRAADELAAAARVSRRDAIDVAEANGWLGELLFRQGRWGEAAPRLRVAAAEGSGAATGRRAALAALAAQLPYRRLPTGPLATEQPLRPGEMPEFTCSIGQRQRVFAIDTGTSMTTLTRSLAADVGVEGRRPAGTVADSAGHDVAAEIGMLPRFAVGDVVLGATPVLVVDDGALALRDLFGGPERTPAGVLGLDVLTLFRLTIDPERRAVVFEVARGLADSESVQCVRADGRCLLPATIDDTRLWLALDTGASHSSLTESGLLALPGGEARAAPSFRRVLAAGGAMVSVREVRELQVRVSATRFSGVTLPIVDRAAGATFPLHGVLGNDLLGRCRLVFDRGRLRLESVS